MHTKKIHESFSSSDCRGYTLIDAVKMSEKVETNLKKTRGFISVHTEITASGYRNRNGELLYKVLSTLIYDDDAPSRHR